MGKTPKKAAPGGDERNLYVRRLKATTAPSKASETSLSGRQRESESLNRLTGIQKRIPGSQGKGLKKKVRSSAKLDLNPTKPLGRPAGTSKEEKIPSPVEKSEDKDTNMQTESEEAEVQLNVCIQEEGGTESVTEKEKDAGEVIIKECVDHTSSENIVPQEPASDTPPGEKETIVTNEQIEVHENENDIQNTSNQSKESEECEANDIKLSFDIEEGTAKVSDETPNEQELKHENKDELPLPHVETKNGTCEKEELQSESHTDTESYSVDIVESTTSELSEASENVPQCDTQKEKKPEQSQHKDVSSVSYDSSILLKDVQIKLNDCLKENFKLFNVTQKELGTPNQSAKDQSFGKTLRSISGRNSLSRMRYVTMRDQRMSPNSSLFVNTSTMSLPQDESSDFKILRYSSGMSDTFSTNGSSVDRKRKSDSEIWSSTKKQKTTESENSLLNTSISLLKGLRRPVQVSTPNVTPYKFQSNKLLTNDDDSEIINEPIESTKKWCIIM